MRYSSVLITLFVAHFLWIVQTLADPTQILEEILKHVSSDPRLSRALETAYASVRTTSSLKQGARRIAAARSQLTGESRVYRSRRYVARNLSHRAKSE